MGGMRENERPATMSAWSYAGGCPSGVPGFRHDHIAWIWLRIWRLVREAATGSAGGWPRVVRRGQARLEMAFQRRRDETRQLGETVAVGEAASVGVVVALRVADVQVVLGPRQSDVEQPQLFLDLLVAARGHVGRDVAVGGVDHEHHVPLQPLGGMDGAEDQVVLVQQRRAGEILGAFRRVQGQLGQQRLAVGEPRGQLLDLLQVAFPRRGVVVLVLQDRFVEAAGERHLRRRGP